MPEETRAIETQNAPAAPGGLAGVGEAERAQILLEINNAVASSLDLRDLFRATAGCLCQYFRHDFAGMALYDEQSGQLRVHSLPAQAGGAQVEKRLLIPLEGTPAGLAYTTRQTVLLRRLDASEFPSPWSSAPSPLASVRVATRRSSRATRQSAR